MTDTKPARPEDIPVATHESEIEFMGVKLRMYVLDDGRRVIHAADMAKVLSIITDSEPS